MHRPRAADTCCPRLIPETFYSTSARLNALSRRVICAKRNIHRVLEFSSDAKCILTPRRNVVPHEWTNVGGRSHIHERGGGKSTARTSTPGSVIILFANQQSKYPKSTMNARHEVECSRPCSRSPAHRSSCIADEFLECHNFRMVARGELPLGRDSRGEAMCRYEEQHSQRIFSFVLRNAATFPARRRFSPPSFFSVLRALVTRTPRRVQVTTGSPAALTETMIPLPSDLSLLVSIYLRHTPAEVLCARDIKFLTAVFLTGSSLSLYTRWSLLNFPRIKCN